MDKILARLKEPSTAIGVPMVVMGLGALFDWAEAGEAASVVESVIPAFASGDWATGAMLTLGVVLGIFMKERAR